MSEQVFTVTIDETSEPVQAGDTLEVTVTVENAGEAGDVTVELVAFDGEVVDSDDLELEAETTETLTLEWEPDPAAVGSDAITVRAADDEATAPVTVEDKPATFEVEAASATEYVPEGGTVRVTGTITNVGTLEGTQTIEISVGDDVLETHELTLAGGESEEIEFETEEGEKPEVTVTIASEDDSANESVPIVTVSVSPVSKVQSKSGMGIFGWLVFLGMVILLLPLLPIYLALKLYEFIANRARPAS